MKRLLIAIYSVLLLTSPAWGAEFLIKARGNQWMENLEKADWSANKLTQEIYDARGEKGDVVEVRKDKAVYGTLECLPDFVIIKVPEFSDYEQAKYVLEGGVYEKLLETVAFHGTIVFVTQAELDSVSGPQSINGTMTVVPQNEVEGARTDVEKYLSTNYKNIKNLVVSKTTFTLGKDSGGKDVVIPATYASFDYQTETHKLKKKRKFHVPTSLVDMAIANGGTLTLTKAQLVGYLQKRSLDSDKKLTSSAVTLQDLEK